MTRFIGQITVILDADTPAAAEQRLRGLARDLDDRCPDIEFADHNGDVDNYEAAEAECTACLHHTGPGVLRFDGYEIHGIREFDKDNDPHCEQVPDSEAEFWSLYGHIPGQGLECIGDFQSRQLAEEVYARITGTFYNT